MKRLFLSCMLIAASFVARAETIAIVCVSVVSGVDIRKEGESQPEA